MIEAKNVKYTRVKEPFWGLPQEQPVISDETFQLRQAKVLERMKERNLDYLLVYADREHYGNFDYLLGFEPRFEEALLVMDQSGKCTILFGNECNGMEKYARLPAEGVLYHAFSLPNQPMVGSRSIDDILKQIGLAHHHHVGLVGWKLFYPIFGEKDMFDIPAFIVEGIKQVVDPVNLINATDIMIHPEYGTRIINTAEDIAYYEFGATYASDAVQQILLNTRTGLTEVELSQFGTVGSLPTNIFPKVLSGSRIEVNMLSPTTKELELGDRYQVSMGLKGGQSNRRGFAAYSAEDLPEGAKDWLENYAKPYFAISANWFEQLKLDKTGGDIYRMVEENYPKDKFNWFLNPGHLISTEEWMSSPIYPGSEITLKSGMVFQMDIIPFVAPPNVAPDLEDGVALADQALRAELELQFPDVYQRIQNRRTFMIEVLGIDLPPEVLPLSNLTGLYRPYMLNRDKAFVIEK